MAVLCVSVLLVCVCVCVCVGDAGRDGLRFSVEIGTSRCLFEELREGELVTGRFHSEREEKTQQRLSLKVFEPSNRRVFLKEDIAGEGEMVFSATDEGKYQFCFDNEHVGGDKSVHGVFRQVTFQLIKGASAHDYGTIARKEQLEPVDLELRRVVDLIQEFEHDVEMMRDIEKDHREISEHTNSLTMWLTILLILLLVLMGFFQTWMTKDFLKKKKML